MLPPGQALGEHVERGVGQLGPLDPPQGIVIGEHVEKREGLEVGAGAAALEAEGVGLDAVEQGGGQPLGDLDVGRPQVLHEDRRGRAVGRAARRGSARLDRMLDRMVIDHEVDLAEALLEEGGLHVHHGDAVELVERLGADLLDLDLEDPAHGHVLGPGDRAEGADAAPRSGCGRAGS